jgi:hypothetical protein
MSRTNCDALWSVTSSDLPHIKNAMNILLGDVAGASLRLEVFARMAGYRTYAALRTRLEAFQDVNGNPFPLRLREQATQDREFFSKLDPHLLRRISHLEETGFMRLVVAALVQSRHPILGDIGLPDNSTIASLRETAERIFDASMLPRDTEPQGRLKRATLILTPENTKEIHATEAFSVFQFSFSSSEDVPMSPAEGGFEMTTDVERIAELSRDRIVYTYSTDDLFKIQAVVSAAGTGNPADYRQLKDMSAHLLDVSVEADFQTMAQAFELEIEDEDDIGVSTEKQCMEWLLVMFMAAEAYHEMQVDQVAGAV